MRIKIPPPGRKCMYVQYIHLRVEKTGRSSGRKGLAPYSIPVHAKIQPLTISMALDIHEVTGCLGWQPLNVPSWLSIMVCWMVCSSLLYVSCFPMPQGCIGCSTVCVHCQLTNNHKDIISSDAINGCHWTHFHWQRKKSKERKNSTTHSE